MERRLLFAPVKITTEQSMLGTLGDRPHHDFIDIDMGWEAGDPGNHLSYIVCGQWSVDETSEHCRLSDTTSPASGDARYSGEARKIGRHGRVIVFFHRECRSQAV
jgi:hypothetical protein